MFEKLKSKICGIPSDPHELDSSHGFTPIIFGIPEPVVISNLPITSGMQLIGVDDDGNQMYDVPENGTIEADDATELEIEQRPATSIAGNVGVFIGSDGEVHITAEGHDD